MFLDYILAFKESKLMISCPIIIPSGRTSKDQIQIYLQQGYFYEIDLKCSKRLKS